jgi:hypothetical protein
MKPVQQQLNLRCYRSAIALNNVGVKLLERQCYSQAVDSLQHARALLMQSSSDANGCGEEHVNRALQHLSHPRPVKAAALLLEVLITTPDGSLLHGEVPTDASALESVLEGAPCSHTAFPIRIEDCLEHSDTRQTSIVSHNLGIACFCLYKAIQGSRRQAKAAQRFRQASLFFSQESSSSFLTSHLSYLQQQSCQRQQSESLELYCLSIAVLNSLIHVQRESSLLDQAKESYCVLVKLRAAALEEDDDYLLLVRDENLKRTGEAAAAA